MAKQPPKKISDMMNYRSEMTNCRSEMRNYRGEMRLCKPR